MNQNIKSSFQPKSLWNVLVDFSLVIACYFLPCFISKFQISRQTSVTSYSSMLSFFLFQGNGGQSNICKKNHKTLHSKLCWVLYSIPSPSPSEQIQIIGGKVCLRCKGKTLSTNFWKQKVCSHHPAMFCLITSSKLSRL